MLFLSVMEVIGLHDSLSSAPIRDRAALNAAVAQS